MATLIDESGHPPESPQPILLSHFDDLDQQELASTLGMWMFLATEVLFFGGLLASYTVYRILSPEEFALGSRHLNPWLGFVNTVVLLTSSLTMAQAVRAARLGRRRDAVRNLVFTAALGAAFLGIKAVEYRAEYVEHLVPGPAFRLPAEDAPPPDAAPLQKARFQLFFVHYFFMTGLHAIHLIIGVALVSLVAYLCERGWFSGGGGLQVEVTGLYWHFVDVVWVFLYPLLYLMDV